MIQKIVTLAALIFIPTLMMAHGSHGDGVMAGFTHPILGADHHVAILGTGVLGYILNQSKWYLAPLAFIVAMVIGGFLGVENEATFLIEKVIAFSVFAIGIMVAMRKSINLTLVLGLLAIFGFFHGYAHGAEMPETNTVFKYIPGFTLGALLLAVTGAFIGKVINAWADNNTNISICSGILIGCGIMMLLP